MTEQRASNRLLANRAILVTARGGCLATGVFVPWTLVTSDTADFGDGATDGWAACAIWEDSAFWGSRHRDCA